MIKYSCVIFAKYCKKYIIDFLVGRQPYNKFGHSKKSYFSIDEKEFDRKRHS